MLAASRTDDTGYVLLAGLYGGGFLYLGFMLEDVRQFCWRQEQLARACFRAASGKGEGEPQTPPYCGRLLGGAAFLVALTILMIFLDELQYTWRRESFLPLLFSFGFMGIAYSLYLLGRDWDQAVAWWEKAASQRPAARNSKTADLLVPIARRGNRPWRLHIWGLGLFAVASVLLLIVKHEVTEGRVYDDAYKAFAQAVMNLAGLILLVLLARVVWPKAVPEMTTSTKAFSKVPRLWVVFGAFWVCLMLAKHGGLPESGFGLVGGGCAFGAAGAFAIWLSVFLPQVGRWRAAQERFWSLWKPELRPQSAKLLPRQWWMVWGTVWLAVMQAVLFSLMMLWALLSSRRPTIVLELLEFSLLVVLMHYPTMWCAMLLREFLALERFYETRRQALSLSEEE